MHKGSLLLHLLLKIKNFINSEKNLAPHPSKSAWEEG